MNRTKWLKELNKLLKTLDKQERTDAVEYYKEIFLDKSELGMTDAEIISELGSPAECAQRILAESGKSSPKTVTNYTQSTFKGVAYILLTVILIIPIICVLFSLVVSFGAVAMSGVVVAVSGLGSAILTPIFSANVLTTQGVIFHIGLGIGACGLGVLMFVGFALLTKFVATFSIKFIKSVYHRGVK